MEGTLSAIRRRWYGGYAWTVAEADGTVTTYNTDAHCYGLWRNGEQILDASEFNLECTEATRRRRVSRFLTRPDLPHQRAYGPTRVPVRARLPMG